MYYIPQHKLEKTGKCYTPGQKKPNHKQWTYFGLTCGEVDGLKAGKRCEKIVGCKIRNVAIEIVILFQKRNHGNVFFVFS